MFNQPLETHGSGALDQNRDPLRPAIQGSIQARVVQTQTGLLLGSAVKTGVAANISALAGGTTATGSLASRRSIIARSDASRIGP